MKIKDYKLNNGKKHLFGLLIKETKTLDYVSEYSDLIPLAMGCFMSDLYKKDSKYKLVKFRVTDMETITSEEAKS